MAVAACRRRYVGRSGGFTLVEMLVVIGIIAILTAILIPVIGRARVAARTASTQSFVQQLSGAIDNYNGDFRSYPGPLSNTEVYNQNFTTVTLDTGAGPDGFDVSQTAMSGLITMSENLTLGLLGGLRLDRTTSTLYYDPRFVGTGANSLNTAGPTKKSQPYIEQKNLSWREFGDPKKKTGLFQDDVGSAKDSLIPEFVDTYTDPMPILYLRAKKGATAIPPYTNINNAIVTFDETNHNNRVGQYDLHQIIGYTGANIGAGRKQVEQVVWADAGPHGLRGPVTFNSVLSNPPPSTPSGLIYKYPYDAYAYFRNHKLSGEYQDASDPRNDVPHQKDAYILISAGPDRLYGTADDITNFGGVAQ